MPRGRRGVAGGEGSNERAEQSRNCCDRIRDYRRELLHAGGSFPDGHAGAGLLVSVPQVTDVIMAHRTDVGRERRDSGAGLFCNHLVSVIV